MSMTSRECVTAALEHREPDRTPIFEYVLLSPVADAFLGRPYAGDPANWDRLVGEKGWKVAVRQEAVDRLDLAVCLGHDLLYVLPNLPHKPSPVEADKPPVCTLGEDPAEYVRQRTERAEEEFSPPHDERFLVYEFLREEMRRRNLDLPILAPAYEHGVWTDVELMLTLLMDPEVARRHFALATRRSLAWTEQYLNRGIELIGVGGDFAGNRPLISPELYREFILPEVRKVSRRIHESDAKAVNASDGNLWPVINDFLIGCEVDGYIEIDQQAGMDLERLKAQYGDRVSFFGNLDCGNVLSFGTQEEVRRHTLDCIEAGWGGGGHILTASNAITYSVPVKNYVAVVNAYRERFGIPLLS